MITFFEWLDAVPDSAAFNGIHYLAVCIAVLAGISLFARIKARRAQRSLHPGDRVKVDLPSVEKHLASHERRAA